MRKYFPAVAAAMILTGCGASGAENEPVRKVDMTVSGAYDTEVSDVTTTDAESDTFYGVLMDECCSDIDDPALHETACMFMDGCRESGYGLDILQPDGSWIFYMFDEKGQQLTWEYLNTTERQDSLYVTVTGTMENEVIKVISIKES